MAKVAKTDMSARITDNKSGVPDRPKEVSRVLRNEENAYQHDMMGRGQVAKTPEDTAKNEELAKMLQREEQRLKKIEQNLQRPDLIEQNLKEMTMRTMNAESEFASTVNMKTDLNMRMTDDPKYRPPSMPEPMPISPFKQAAEPLKPSVTSRQPSAGGELYTAMKDNVKTDVMAGITDNRSRLGDLSKTMENRLREEERSYQRDLKNAPDKRDANVPKQEALAGVSNVSTKTYAYITDNRSKMRELSGTTRERLHEEEESYLRDMHPHAGAIPEAAKSPKPGTQQAGTAQAGASGVPSPRPQGGVSAVTSPRPQVGAFGMPGARPQVGASGVPSPRPQVGASGVPSPRPQVGASGVPSPRSQVGAMPEGEVGRGSPGGGLGRAEGPVAGGAVGGTEAGASGGPNGSARGMARPKRPTGGDYSDSEERELERNVCWLMPERVQRMFAQLRSQRPYGEQCLLEMEVEDETFDPSLFPVAKAAYPPREGRVMYATPSAVSGRRTMYDMEGEYDMIYEDELDPRMLYQDIRGGGVVYADGGIMYAEQQPGIMYQDEQAAPMYMKEPQQRVLYQNQRVQATPQRQMIQPREQFAYPTGRAAVGTYRPSQNTVRQIDYIKVSVSESDEGENWPKRYPSRGPKRHRMQQTQGYNQAGFGMYVNTQQYPGQALDGDSTQSSARDFTLGTKTAAVQTMLNVPVSTRVQTDRPFKETKSVYTTIETGEMATQQNRPMSSVSDTQTYPPYVPGASMPFLGMGQMGGPFVMGPMGPISTGMFPQSLAPQLQVPPPASSACLECDKEKVCCEDVPFADLQRNIEEDIANIVNENTGVKIRDEDTKILIARPDSPYKLVYLIPQRTQLVREETNMQMTTASVPEDKGIQTDRKGRQSSRRSIVPDDEETDCQVIVSKTQTKECQVNGKRVRTTKSFRITRPDEEESGTEVIHDSEISKRGRNRSKPRSKTRPKRAVSEGKYPQSLTISVGRSSTTEGSRSPSRDRKAVRSPGTSRSYSPRPPGRRWKKLSITSSSSGASSRTNVSIIGVSSNAATASLDAEYCFSPSDGSPIRSCSMTEISAYSTAQAPARYDGMVCEDDIQGRYDNYRNPRETRSSKVYVERVYPQCTDTKSRPARSVQSRAYSPGGVSLGSPRRTDVCTRTADGFTRRITDVYTVLPADRASQSPTMEQPPRVSARPRSASTGRRSPVTYEDQSTARAETAAARQTSRYAQAEQIAKQIAEQIAPQLSVIKQMEPQRYAQQQPSMAQPTRSVSVTLVQGTSQQPILKRASRVAQMAGRPQDDYQGGCYPYRGTYSQERLITEQTSRANRESQVKYNGEMARSVSQSISPQFSRQQPSRYAFYGGTNKRMMVPASMSQTLRPTYQQASPRTNYTPYSRPSPMRQARPRYILPIQLQVTGRASRGPATAVAFRAAVPLPSHAEVMPQAKAVNVAAMKREIQQQGARSPMTMEGDAGSPRAQTPQRCPVNKKRAFYNRAYRLRIPAQEKQVLTYALVALVALISVILVINTIGKRRAMSE